LSCREKIDDIITKLNLHQSAFCIDFFDAEIQITETSLQALVFSPAPQGLAHRLKEIRKEADRWLNK